MYLDDDGYARLPDLACPSCGHTIDASATLPGEEPMLPSDGDFCICFRCASLAVYVIGATGVALRLPTPEERAEAVTDRGGFIKELLDFNERHPWDRRQGRPPP